MLGRRRIGAQRVQIQDSLETLVFQEETLSCLLRLSPRRRTLALRVSAGGQLVVNAPLRVSLGTVQGFVGKHLDWIRHRQAAVQMLAQFPAQRFSDGQMLPYLGRSLKLSLLPTMPGEWVRVNGDELHCHAPADQVETAILKWYRAQAAGYLAQRLAEWAQVAARATPVLRISNAQTRWGSLSPKGLVSLNWRLIKASAEEIDYVICHELAHFRQRNHSPAFWREVEKLFPACIAVRRRLRENGRMYFQF